MATNNTWLPVRLNAQGVAECLSLDGMNCQWASGNNPYSCHGPTAPVMVKPEERSKVKPKEGLPSAAAPTGTWEAAVYSIVAGVTGK